MHKNISMYFIIYMIKKKKKKKLIDRAPRNDVTSLTTHTRVSDTRIYINILRTRGKAIIGMALRAITSILCVTSISSIFQDH